MSSVHSRRGACLLLACCAAAMLAGAARAEPPATRQWNFKVFLDGRDIGHQHFQLRRSPEGLRLETRAQFAVKFFQLTVYAYDHHNTELWRDGCLERIESRTDSNGEHYRVSGVARGGNLLVSTGGGEQRIEDCVASFAYWDRQLLERPRLLNSQTGEYLPVRLKSLGTGRLVLGEQAITVQRYALTAPDLDIELAYAADSGEWLALDSRLEKGRVLQYRRDPADLPSAAASALAANLDLE
jgi:hypothetical protein